MAELLSIRRQTLDIKINQFKKSLEEELEKNRVFFRTILIQNVIFAKKYWLKLPKK